MFGFLRKKCVPILDTDVIKLMPADRAHFTDLICGDDTPRDLYKVTGVEVTIRRQSVERKLVQCRDTVKEVVSLLKKRQAIVYYVAPKWFELDVVNSNRQRVRCRVRFNITSETSAGLVDWLELNVKTPGETLSIEKVSSLLGGKPKPGWLDVRDVEIVEESPPAEVAHETTDKFSSMPVGLFQKDSVVLDRYLIERELGEGGMGKAYLARDQKTPNKMREHVVIKVPHIETAYDPHAVERFVKEAETLSSLRDDRIAACYDFPLLGETPILIMEYVEGVSLNKFLAMRDSPLDEQETREFLRPIAQALDYAHQQKIYHLDVKPQNIIVRAVPKVGLKTCLLDFGISKKAHLDGSMTFTMSVTGTPLYMSQEQRNGEPASVAMDVYALAVTAYECLAGEMPYPHGQTRNHAVRPLPGDTPFTQAIMRGLDIDPSRRPRTCAELIDPLCEELVEQEATANPEIAVIEVSPQTGMDSLSDLAKTFANYRAMLAQSARLVARNNEEYATWMQDRQATLRDLTRDLSKVEPQDLTVFFLGVKAKLVELGVGAEDFFLATDRLTELRCGLPEQGGPIWQAILESVS